MVLFISGSGAASFGTRRKRGSVFHFLPSLSSRSRIRFRSDTDARPAHQYSKYAHSFCISRHLGRAACRCRGMAISFISAGERNAASEDILIQSFLCFPASASRNVDSLFFRITCLQSGQCHCPADGAVYFPGGYSPAADVLWHVETLELPGALYNRGLAL